MTFPCEWCALLCVRMVELEKEHVHKVYSKIAVHFSDTRFKPWPKIAQFLQERPLGSLIADVGMGDETLYHIGQ